MSYLEEGLVATAAGSSCSWSAAASPVAAAPEGAAAGRLAAPGPNRSRSGMTPPNFRFEVAPTPEKEELVPAGGPGKK